MSGATDSRVGLLGTGLMGTAMAHRLLGQDVAVIAWDREPDHVQPLAERGAEVAGTAGEVVSRAHAVITMLPTAEIVRSVVEPLLDEWPQETIWLQMSSVGAAEADRLVELATAHGVTLFDAPVSGSTHPAEEGQLTILASGPDQARKEVEPVFEALGSRVQWVGQAGMGSRLKLAANHWMIAMVAALAESMHLCQLMRLEEQQFVTLLDGGPLGSPYGVEKLGEMQRHQYPAGFPVRLALKDLKLVREVAKDSGVELPLLDAVLERIGDVENRHANDDLAAVYELKLPSRAQR
ncbi:MAG: NAD(P)-dependent oxidoreductase [Solirubrobacterales bacterium]|nr:NAD(P)-dependent oxidoreductase [Solirubrobacterales bacterium]MBV9366409.1 NAD(P)-dependent oxidoreductase [Solirubrobacterales bacterium]MBV9681060.1 NAD(P)-dependent oxidoreductase [Solirubrobacterales bacterium]